MPNEQLREASRAGSVPGRTRSLFGKLLATALLVYLVYLWPIPAPLVIRQLYLARSISEGSLSIDPYVPPVGDAAAIGSHFYATTPPLEAALGAPIVVVSKASGLVASDPVPWSRKDEVLALVPFTAILAALAGALAVAFLGQGLLALGAERRVAILGALVFAFATPIFPYSTIAQAGALSCLGVALAVTSFARGSFLLGGLGLGLAQACEYHAIWAVVPLGLSVLFGKGFKAAIVTALGALPPLLGLCAYHYAATGDPLDAPEAHFHMAGEAIAFPYTYPQPLAIAHLLGGPYKGLFLYWPVLALGVVGLVRIARAPGEGRWLASGLLATAAVVVLANSAIPARTSVAWFSWESYGPRHSLLAVPCLAYGIAAGLEGTGEPRPEGTRASDVLKLVLVLVSFASAWAGAQCSWSFSVFEAPLELVLLGPRLRAASILTYVLELARDPELVGLVSALVAFPILLAFGVFVWREEIRNPRRWTAFLLFAALASDVLAGPYLLSGRGTEESVRTEAARRSVLAEATLTERPRRLVIMATLIERKGQPQDAIVLLRMAVERGQDEPDALSDALSALVRLGDRKTAHAAARRLLVLRPTDAELNVLYAIELWEAGRKDEAAARWSDVLSKRPDIGERPELKAQLQDLGLLQK